MMNPSRKESRNISPPILGLRCRPQGWYVAELVQECRIEGCSTSHVWVNIHTIKARTAEEAYSKAITLGRKNNQKYKGGKEGLQVIWKFRGLRQLLPIYEKIADGAELFFESHARITAQGVMKMLCPKKHLMAFREESSK